MISVVVSCSKLSILAEAFMKEKGNYGSFSLLIFPLSKSLSDILCFVDENKKTKKLNKIQMNGIKKLKTSMSH